jgi:hypothetical protein
MERLIDYGSDVSASRPARPERQQHGADNENERSGRNKRLNQVIRDLHSTNDQADLRPNHRRR